MPTSLLSLGRGVPDPSALRVVCVPHAGGHAGAFRGWVGPLSARGFGLLVAQQEGASTTGEPWSLRARAVGLARELERLTSPYVVLGHSMGGLIAFEAVRELERRRTTPPARLVVCATAAPGVRTVEAELYSGDDDRLVDFVGLMGGTPPEVWAEPELRELVLSRLRHDLTALAGYAFDGEATMCPVSVYAGRDDATVAPHELAAWRGVATSATMTAFDGGHFFVHEQTGAVCDQLRRELTEDPA